MPRLGRGFPARVRLPRPLAIPVTTASAGFLPAAFTLAGAASTVVSASAALTPAAFTLAAAADYSTASAAFAPAAFTLAAQASYSTASAAFAPGAFTLAAGADYSTAAAAFAPTAFSFSAGADYSTAALSFSPGPFTLSGTMLPLFTAAAAFAPGVFILFAVNAGPPEPTTVLAVDVISATLAGSRGPIAMQFVFEQRDLATFQFYADITTAVQNVQITLDNDQPVARTAQFQLNARNLPATFDPSFPSKFGIQVWVQLLVQGAWQTFPFGFFYLDLPQQSFSPGGGQIWVVQGSDPTILLANRAPVNPYAVGSGTNYLSAVNSIISQFGLRQNLPSTALTTPADSPWAAGTSWLQIANDILNGINYYPLWADAQGILTTRARIDPSTEVPAVVYSTTQEPRMVSADPNAAGFTGGGAFVRLVETSVQPNVVTVTIDDPLRTPAAATHTNADPTSIASTVVTGRQSLLELRGSSQPGSRLVYDGSTAGQIAAFLVRDAAGRAQPAALGTIFDPRRTNREWYTLSIDTIEQATLWRVKGWTVTIDITQPGQVMVHTLHRASAVAVS